MEVREFIAEWEDENPTVLVHTSGSTGTPKPLLAEKRRMQASARITCQFLGLKQGDTALLCLPLDYIAGKMMVVRALTCGLRLLSVVPGGHPLSQESLNAWQPVDFAAMVPLQVWNSLQVPAERERLVQIRHLIIGGGAISPPLAAALQQLPNAVWSTYGMTETLSHIALRRLSGAEATEWYTPFEGVGLSLSADGCLVVSAPAVCAERLVTHDLAELRADGRFRILGRIDNTICSGGIKIQIEEAERLLAPHLSVPFCISWQPDPRLGQAVVLLTEHARPQQLRDVCRQHLPPLWQPRRYQHVSRIPLTPTGKVARKEAERLAALAVEI